MTHYLPLSFPQKGNSRLSLLKLVAIWRDRRAHKMTEMYCSRSPPSSSLFLQDNTLEVFAYLCVPAYGIYNDVPPNIIQRSLYFCACENSRWDFRTTNFKLLAQIRLEPVEASSRGQRELERARRQSALKYATKSVRSITTFKFKCKPLTAFACCSCLA